VESIAKLADIVVSKSLAETVNSLLSNSNRKLSKMGKVLLLLITLPKTCNCFNKYELDTISSVLFYFFLGIYFILILKYKCVTNIL
jgi:hypothetical protein